MLPQKETTADPHKGPTHKNCCGIPLNQEMPKLPGRERGLTAVEAEEQFSIK